MARTRAQAQQDRNRAVASQLRAKAAHGAGSKEHLAAMEVTRGHGRAMKAAVASGDTSGTGRAEAQAAQTGLLAGSGISLTPAMLGGTTSTADTTTTSYGPTIPVWNPEVRTRGGFDPDTMIDYTNTNPAYWTSVVSFFKSNENGNPATGELGIWIPNLEKEGAERTALAAIAGGVTAHVNSNYANRTVTDSGRTGTDFGTASYRGGAEKAIRLAGTHREGVLTDTGYAMGSTAPTEHGVHIKGGRVVKGAGADYVKGGGDFGGLLSRGDAITGDWLTGILGGMDKDGMRIGGTYPAVRGATGSGIGAGGTKTTVGGLYGGGVDPLASMPKVADYTAYMDPNSIFGGLSENAALKSGLLYQPMASDYGAKMEAAGMPAFSPGLLGGGGGVGSVTYGSPVSSFMKPKVATTASSSSTLPIGSTTAKYAIPETIWGYKSSLIPKFASKSALDKFDPTTATGGTSHWAYTAGKGWTPGAFVGGELYTPGAGEGSGGMWDLYRTYDPVKAT